MPAAYENEAWHYRVPISGRLRIKDDRLFCQWHRMVVLDGGKRLIPDYVSGMPAAKSALHSLGSGGITSSDGFVGKQHIEYFIGTKSDFDKYVTHPLEIDE